MEAHALWAPHYDNSPNPLLSLEQGTVEPLLPPMEGMDVLDLACGPGRWLERLIQRRARTAVGVDVSREMLKQARSKPRLPGRLVEAEALGMPLRVNSMDFAICSFGLSYMTDAERFAGELAGVLRDEARLVITDFHPDAQARGWKRSFRHQDDVVEIASFTRSLEDIQNAFTREGLLPLASREPSFGEAERTIFEACGKAALFGELRGLAAIYVFVFRKESGARRTAPR
jgi:ubiquinone/menaquinone biosynthesis C-methylase UbiE